MNPVPFRHRVLLLRCQMGRRSDLIEACARDLGVKCGMLPEPELLDRVIKACGARGIYRRGRRH